MPDIRALLRDAAALPSTPIDLDEVRRRSRRRRAARRVAAAALTIAAVVGLGGLALSLDDRTRDRVELIGPADQLDLDRWSGLAGLVPASSWKGVMSFGSAGGELPNGAGFGANGGAMRESFGFDPSDFEQWVNGGEPPAELTIATGDFDPATIDAAVRADPDWSPLLEVETYRSRTFYAWGGEFAIVGDPSPGRPLGRGGRLFVTDEMIVWTQGDDEMRAIIDQLLDGPLAPPPAQNELVELAERDGLVSLGIVPEQATASSSTAIGQTAMGFGSGEPPRPGWSRTFGAVVFDSLDTDRATAVTAAIDELRLGIAPTIEPVAQAGADELSRRMALLDARGELHLRSGVDDAGYWISFDFPESNDDSGSIVENPGSTFQSVLRALSE